MRKIMKDKKGISLTGWTEGILLSVLVVVMLGVVIAGMNSMYNKNNNLGLGTDTTQGAFNNYQKTLAGQVSSGNAEFTSSLGLSLTSSLGMIKSGISIVWDFITGGWIETLVSYMHLPAAVGTTFRVLYFLSMGFILLRILFRVRP